MEKKSSECVKVVVRCRPRNKKEIAEERKNIVTIDTSMGQVCLTNPKAEVNNVRRFTYDAVYDENSTQKMVYDETAFPLVESVLEGFNGTIFAYGQTGCGKTWTMTGREDSLEESRSLPEDQKGQYRGVIPNSFDHIFKSIKLKIAEHEAAKDKSDQSKTEFLVRASYLEIYNEEIRDLMSSDPDRKLDLKETPDKGVFVKDLKYQIVEDKEQIDQLLEKGSKNRTVAKTLMNDVSSRSHSIFGIVIEMNDIDAKGENHFRVGKLNLVDLAGSERQSKTGATGDRLKEGCKINMSLSALGNVIKALVDGNGKHIPYRDSKLTRLLQDSLGGNTKTVMITAISPADYNYDETWSTLRYANRAKNIKNKPVINEDPKDAMLREYKEKIEQLKLQLQQQQHQTISPDIVSSSLNPGANSQSPLPVTKIVEVEKVVEKVVKVGVEDKKIKAEHKALLDYSDAVVEQRNRLGEELDKKEEEIARQQRERKELEQKLTKLQSCVLGKSDPNRKYKGEEDPEIVAALKEREYRRTQLKLKQQRRKQAELEQARLQAEEEKLAIESEFKNAKGAVEAKERALRAMKKQMISKMDQARQEIRELEQEFQSEREGLLETIREQTKEIKRLDQVVDLFLPATERSKLWELAEWEADKGQWKLPKLRPRKQYSHITLPGLNQPAEGGAEVVADSRRPSSRAGRTHSHRSKQKSTSKLNEVDEEELARQKRRRERRRRKRAEREKTEHTGEDFEPSSPEDNASLTREDVKERRRERRQRRKREERKREKERQKLAEKDRVRAEAEKSENQSFDNDMIFQIPLNDENSNDEIFPRKHSAGTRSSSSYSTRSSSSNCSFKSMQNANTSSTPALTTGNWPASLDTSQREDQKVYGDRCQSRQEQRRPRSSRLKGDKDKVKGKPKQLEPLQDSVHKLQAEPL